MQACQTSHCFKANDIRNGKLSVSIVIPNVTWSLKANLPSDLRFKSFEFSWFRVVLGFGTLFCFKSSLEHVPHENHLFIKIKTEFNCASNSDWRQCLLIDHYDFSSAARKPESLHFSTSMTWWCTRSQTGSVSSATFNQSIVALETKIKRKILKSLFFDVSSNGFFGKIFFVDF